MRFKLLALTIGMLVLCSCSGVDAARDRGKARVPELLDHMPVDPLMASVMKVDELPQTFDSILDMIAKLGDDPELKQVRDRLAEFDRKLGCSVRDDLLGQLGSELAFVVDLPPLDQLMASMAMPAMVPQSMKGIGLMARVGDEKALDACLRKLFTMAETTPVEEDGLVKIPLPMEENVTVQVGLYYGFRDGVLALGITPDFVRPALEGRKKGERLVDGEDFGRVFAHLDPSYEGMTYVNLPKIREMVASSGMVQGMAAADPQVKPVMDLLLSPEFTGMGAGTTSVEVDGGTLRTSYGPSVLTGGTATTGMIAAVAVPNFLNAVDRGKQKRTMADIRSVATAVETFSIDENRYPTSLGGTWVPIDQIASKLEPTYIRKLPREDGWGNKLMFQGNGREYRIVSPGKDGKLDRNWTGHIQGGGTSTFSADIVFGDGQFLVWPEGEQS